MTSNLRAKSLNLLCQRPHCRTDAPEPETTLIFGNWGCAIIILFFIVIAVLNAIGDLFS